MCVGSSRLSQRANKFSTGMCPSPPKLAGKDCTGTGIGTLRALDYRYLVTGE